MEGKVAGAEDERHPAEPPGGSVRKLSQRPSGLLATILISLGSALLLVVLNECRENIGDVRAFSPSAYAVIRGTESFPSDHLVLPIPWGNRKGRPVGIVSPRVQLVEIADSGEQLGGPITFEMAGEYGEVSGLAFRRPFVLTDSFVLPPNSRRLRVLVFHVKDWWNSESSDYRFRFEAGKRYVVCLYFRADEGDEQGTRLLVLPIFGQVGELAPGGWDYFYLSGTDQRAGTTVAC